MKFQMLEMINVNLWGYHLSCLTIVDRYSNALLRESEDELFNNICVTLDLTKNQLKESYQLKNRQMF